MRRPPAVGIALAEETGRRQERYAPGTTIEELLGAAELLNLNDAARRIGAPLQALYAKVRRRSSFNATCRIVRGTAGTCAVLS